VRYPMIIEQSRKNSNPLNQELSRRGHSGKEKGHILNFKYLVSDIINSTF
jgi:hypothetical protein